MGLNVQRLRQEKGWSQEELAFQSGLHRTYVSGVERGKRNPTVVVLDRLARSLGRQPGEAAQDIWLAEQRRYQGGRRSNQGTAYRLQHVPLAPLGQRVQIRRLHILPQVIWHPHNVL